MKVTRITQGGLLSRTGRNSGAGEVGLNDYFPHVRQESAEASQEDLSSHIVADGIREGRVGCL
jgi:hypothetical protein